MVHPEPLDVNMDDVAYPPEIHALSPQRGLYFLSTSTELRHLQAAVLLFLGTAQYATMPLSHMPGFFRQKSRHPGVLVRASSVSQALALLWAQTAGFTAHHAVQPGSDKALDGSEQKVDMIEAHAVEVPLRYCGSQV